MSRNTTERLRRRYIIIKGEFREAIKLRYGWEFNDIPTVCVYGDLFDADHAMICMRGGYIIQRHNEIRNLEAEILQAVCTDVEVEPVLQEVTGEVLPRGANKAPDAAGYPCAGLLGERTVCVL